MRRRAICGVLVPRSLASACEFEEYAPPSEETCFRDVKKAHENLSCVAIEEGAVEFRDDSFWRQDRYQRFVLRPNAPLT